MTIFDAALVVGGWWLVVGAVVFDAELPMMEASPIVDNTAAAITSVINRALAFGTLLLYFGSGRTMVVSMPCID